MTGEQRERKPSPTLTKWLTDAFGLLVAAVTVVGAFVTITPIEIDTVAELSAVVLFVVAVTCAGALLWGRWHRRHGWRPTVLLAVLAVLALAGGLLLVISAASDSPTVAGSPTLGSLAPTTTPSTADQVQPGPAGSGAGASGGGPAPRPVGDGQVVPPNTVPPTSAAYNPRTTQSTGWPVPAPDAIRYQGEFRLSASQESVDLDLNPPQAYGPANELAVDDHAIWTVPPQTTGVAVGNSATRAQCAEAIDRANPPAEYFDDPQPGDNFCVRTSDGRYALVRVVSSATKDFTLALTVWR